MDIGCLLILMSPFCILTHRLLTHPFCVTDGLFHVPQIRDESVAHLIASQSDTVNGIEPAIEKWDLEFIKREKIRREVSLADQIQAVKKNKADLIPMGGLKTLSYDSTPEGKAGDG